MRSMKHQEELLNGKYKFLKKKLGEGGFGVVHLVENVENGKALVI